MHLPLPRRPRPRAVIVAAALAIARPAAGAGGRPGAPRPVGAPVAVSRTFVVQRVNGAGLPFHDRFSTTPGYEHRLRLERVLVRLDPTGTFVMTVQGAYKDAPRDLPPGAGQSRDEAVRGRWTLQGRTVTLTPAPTRKGRQYAPATGTLAGGALTLRYTVGWAYGGRAGSRSYQLGAVHDPSYF